MPIKRNLPTKAVPAKRRTASVASRASAKRVTVKAAASVPVSLEEAPVAATPRFLSADEKRQLILAHAAMRHPRDPVQMMSVWAGVAVTVLVLVVGYWYATKPSFVEASQKPFDEQLAPALEDVSAFTQKMKTLPGFFQENAETQKQAPNATKELDRLQQEAQARQHVLESLAGKIHDEDAPVRVDLIKPVTP